MSSATLGEADAKFPTTSDNGLPPKATPENPGQVYPKTDPSPAPRGTVPGTAQSEEKAAESDRMAKAKRLVKKVTGDEDPQSVDSGGMFKD